MKKSSSNISSGYKPSPLGPIPEDWEVKRLGEIAEIGSGGTPSKSHSEYWNGNIPWVTTSLLNNPYIENAEEYITEEGLNNSSAKMLNEGVLLMAMYGQGQTRGKVSKLLIRASTNQACAYIDVQTGLVDYIHQTLIANYESIRNESNDGNQKNLSLGIISNIRISFPPLSEQHRIVDVLELWDTAIAKQTALIEQLTLRKRGLTQQLLTGKKRLKGFEGGNFHRLGNYISECNRRNAGCNRVLSVTNTRGFILQEEQFDKIVASNDTSNYKVVRRGEFAYNPSRVNVGSLAMLNDYDEGILSPMYIVFKANENIDKTYLLQCLQSWWFRGHIPAYTQGSVRDSLSFDGLCSMKFYIPTLQEQKAISAILEQADKEIEIQKQKLAAMQEQKKGLMQVLLTGKKRIN